ncbi:hypothetical protein J2T60_001600 [Natronospira proteinivora]|uniref:Halobacterial output domain-containing protein n=1 Tax=Natronospira proteinivora TaxID=1807133 RepID=A0ABT1G9L8_9GAMM|nr:hypothetical protein [Natronospira proteinivora]MCP1727600.1 hypothetical protein [Natronospira proteinivora]
MKPPDEEDRFDDQADAEPAVPGFSREAALNMAAWRAKVPVSELKIYDELPPRASPYMTESGDCWWIMAPWNDGVIALRSSRLIGIRKSDGRVLYDGSAGDEG